MAQWKPTATFAPAINPPINPASESAYQLPPRLHGLACGMLLASLLVWNQRFRLS